MASKCYSNSCSKHSMGSLSSCSRHCSRRRWLMVMGRRVLSRCQSNCLDWARPRLVSMLDVPLMRAASSGSAAGTAAPRMAGMIAARTKNFILAIAAGVWGCCVDGIAFGGFATLSFSTRCYLPLPYIPLPFSSLLNTFSTVRRCETTVTASSVYIFQPTKTKLRPKPQYTSSKTSSQWRLRPARRMYIGIKDQPMCSLSPENMQVFPV